MAGDPLSIVHWGKYFPPEMGGIEVVTRDLAMAHAAMGHRVAVVCFTRAEPGASTVGGVTVHRCRERWSRASQPLSLRYARTGLTLAREAQVVHLHAPNLLASLMSLALGREHRLVVHWHSDIVEKGWLGKLVRPIERLMLKRADAILCTSEAYAERSSALRPWRDKVRCVPIGIHDPLQASSLGTLPDGFEAFLAGRPLVFAAGRLVPYKGFLHLIEAVGSLPGGAVVAIAGEGPLRAELQARIDALGQGHRVRLLGRVSDMEMHGLFAAARVFCLPSVARSEAFGVAILEAMARGIPVVATDIPGSGVPWVNQHGVSGLNVPPGDPAALAQACGALLEQSELRAALGRGGRSRFLALFEVASSAEGVMSVYLDRPA